MLIGQDNAIIAVEFGQFAIEGYWWSYKVINKNSNTNEILQILSNQFDRKYILKRTEQLKKNVVAVDKMKC